MKFSITLFSFIHKTLAKTDPLFVETINTPKLRSEGRYPIHSKTYLDLQDTLRIGVCLRKNLIPLLRSTIRDDWDTLESYQNTPRLYVGSNKPLISLVKDQVVQLSPNQSHYLIKVLRIFSNPRERHLVRLFDGNSGEWIAQIIPMDQSDDKKVNTSRRRNQSSIQAKCLFQSRAMHIENSTTLTTCWLFFAPIKLQRTKILIEKCTELGCDLFIPVSTDHTENSSLISFTRAAGGDRTDVSEEGDNLKRLEGSLYKSNMSSSSASEKLSIIAMEASEQSERLRVPMIAMNLLQAIQEMENENENKIDRHTIWSIKKILEFWTDSSNQTLDDRVLLICRERKDITSNVSILLGALDELHKRGTVQTAFLIGPEGGWSIQEELLFDRFSYEFPQRVMCVSLGSSILRAETAATLAIGSFVLWRESRLLN